MAMIHFNGKLSAKLAASAGLVYLSFAVAQPPAQQSPAQAPGAAQSQPGARPPTLEDRVAALERGLASVTTRFDIRESSVPPAQSGIQNAAFETRVSSLERAIAGLQQQLQSAQRAADSAQRAADSASRDAGDARRTAQSAENIARDTLLRTH
jgi:ABC-type transporter Mla subunit MlaD